MNRHLVPDAHARGHLDGSPDHVARSRHHELYVVHDFQHLLRRRQEIFRTLLHGDSAEEQDDLLVLVNVVLFDVPGSVGFNGVVDDFDLGRVDAVMVSDQVLGQITDGDDLHGAVHPTAFDVVDALIHVQARPVEFRAVNVNDQGNALESGNGHPGGKRHPIVGMDHVDVFRAGDFRRQRRIAGDFREHVAGVRCIGCRRSGANKAGDRPGRTRRRLRRYRQERFNGRRGLRAGAAVFHRALGCIFRGRLVWIAQLRVNRAKRDVLKFVQAKLGAWRRQGRSGPRAEQANMRRKWR